MHLVHSLCECELALDVVPCGALPFITLEHFHHHHHHHLHHLTTTNNNTTTTKFITNRSETFSTADGVVFTGASDAGLLDHLDSTYAAAAELSEQYAADHGLESTSSSSNETSNVALGEPQKQWLG